MMGKKDTFAELTRPVRFLGPVMASLVAASILMGGVGTAHAQQCLLEENGSGTVDLPLQCAGGYGNPEDYHLITDGLPEGSTIRVQVTWGSFTGVVSTPGGNLGGEIQTFVPSVIMNMRGTGELDSFSHFTPLVNTFGEEHSGGYPPFGDLQNIPLELVELVGEGRSTIDPYFSVLRYEIGSGLDEPLDPTLGEANLMLDRPGVCVGGQSPGQTCARDTQCPDSSTNGFCVGGVNDGLFCTSGVNCPGGACVNEGTCDCPGGPCVPSYVSNGFFDVRYALEYVGKPGGPLEGYSGRSTGTIRMYAGAFKFMYMRPPGSDFREIKVNAGDTFDVETYVRQLVPKRLSAYQASFPIAATPLAGARGTVTHVAAPPACDQTRWDWVYFELSPAPWVNCTYSDKPVCFAFFFNPPTEGYPIVTDQRYLAHFTYEASSDADGDFEIPFVNPCAAASCETTLADGAFVPMPFETSNLIVHVNAIGPEDPVPGPPVLVHGTGDVDETYPCTGYIDPRLESDNGVDLNVGVNQVIMVFNEPVFKVGGAGSTPADTTSFIVTETGGGLAPNVVDVGTSDNISYTVTLDRFITLQDWTTIRADVVDTCDNAIVSVGDLGPGEAEPDRLDIAFLPGDINQSAQVSLQDLINLRQFLTADSFHNDCGDLLYFDIDRDGLMPEPQDLIRFRQMSSGAEPATRNWTLAALNNPQP